MTASTAFQLRRAKAADAAELTEIAFAAKRHWEYPEAWIALWSSELTIDERYIEENWVLVAEDENRSLGWCAITPNDGIYWIDYCWVLPEAAGKGIGGTLVRTALDYATEQGMHTLKVVADPHAEGFYRKLGFQRIGEHPSVPAGRMLPVLEIAT